MKKFRVTVEGKAYEVLVENLDEGVQTHAPAVGAAPAAAPRVAAPAPAPVPVAPPPAAPAPKGPTGAGDIVSPLAGKVVSIDVTLGDAVKEGAKVATLEAMKMNTYIFAPQGGRVETIAVSAGDAVEEGTLLLRLV